MEKTTLIGTQINCLDHGFVRLVDYMGDDSSIVQAARVSYGQGTKQVHEDRGLIRYLVRHHHWTPVEMVEIKFHVKIPVFVARQWIRHRTANVNEISARYSEMPNEIYLPDLENINSQSKDNKQGRNPEPMPIEISENILNDLQQHADGSYTLYKELIDKGVAKELARTVLPVSHYTEWYWKIDLRNLMNFLALRLDQHAQYEIRVFAEAIAEITKKIAPFAWEAFEDYILYSSNFSRTETEILKKTLATHVTEIQESSEFKSLSKREQKEFLEKFTQM